MKRNLLLMVAIVLLLTSSVWAQSTDDRTFASETITVTSAEVKTLASDTYTVNATKAQLIFTGGDMRYTLDGSNPDSTTGYFVSPNSSPSPITLWLGKYELRNFKVIATTSGWNGTVTVSYYKK
jgi:hypothetical protein